MTFPRLIAILVSCLLLTAGSVEAASETGVAFELFRPARAIPALNFADGSGQTAGLAQFKGKFVLLNIWATWCGPCRKEMAGLDRLQASRPELAVVALSVDRGGVESVRGFYAREGLRHLAIYNDAHEASSRLLNARAIPATFLIGSDGKALWRIDGNIDWDAQTARGLIDYYLGRTAPLG